APLGGLAVDAYVLLMKFNVSVTAFVLSPHIRKAYHGLWLMGHDSGLISNETSVSFSSHASFSLPPLKLLLRYTPPPRSMTRLVCSSMGLDTVLTARMGACP